MKNNILRAILFLAVFICGFSGPVWLFFMSAVGYIVIYAGVEIIILAAAIDAYFGYAHGIWFMYTVSVAIILFVAQWLRPHLSVYNQS